MIEVNKKVEKIMYWKKRVIHYKRKYSKNSIEAKSAKLNLDLEIARNK